MAALPLIDAKIAALSAQPQPAVVEAVAYQWPKALRVSRNERNHWHGDISFARCPTDNEIEALSAFLKAHHENTAPPLAPDARMRRALERIRDDGPDHGVRWCRNIASEALRADEGKESEGGCMADFSPGDPANLQELMSGASPSDPTPPDQREAIARIIKCCCCVRVQGEYHAPADGIYEAADRILALQPRAGG
jgi:hypothetical protein